MHQAGQLQEAETVYRQLLGIDPDHADANHLLGVLLSRAGNHAQAVDLISRAIAMAPNQPMYHNNLGIALKAIGRLDDAVASYHKAVAIKPDYADAHSNLGNLLQALGRLDDAVASYRKALAIEPDYADTHNNLGNALQALGRLDDAVASYRKAVIVKPNYADAHNNLGNLLQKLGQLDDAIASYHKAVAIEPDYAEAYNNLGAALHELGKLDEAVANNRKALAIKPDYAEAHNNLGLALQALGKPDEATASYRKALAIKPDYAEAHRHLATVRKFSEYDKDIKAMEDTYAMPGLSDEQRMHLAFGLGKSFEDLQQLEKAFGFFVTGNAIKRGTYSFSIESVERDLGYLKKLFTKNLFAQHRPAGSPDETPIFVLGMMRSGTTLVEQILASHPKVHAAGEIADLDRVVTSYFSKMGSAEFTDSVNQASAGHFLSAGSGYISKLRKHSAEARFITDKMPNNFWLIGMIGLMLPNAKIIHCRRDSRDTCLSIFKNYFSRDGNYHAYDLGELGRYYNLYRDLMTHWHSVLPDFIYDLHYEDMVADQAEQTRLLLKHCGLDWEDACLEFYKSDRPVATASVEQVRRPIYKDSVQSWKRYEKQLAPLLEILG